MNTVLSTHEYTNRNDVKFIIDVKEALVPEDADFIGYFFHVHIDSRDNEKGRIYKALVKKSFCDTKSKADMWLHITALDFLKTILETYKDGQTIMLWPESDKWSVI